MSDLPSPLSALAAYDIDAARGFLPGVDPLRALGSGFDAWDALSWDLSAHLRSGSLAAAIGDLPEFDLHALHSPARQERALLLLTILGNACVWGCVREGRPPNLVIPAKIAVPLCAVAQTLDRPAIVHYASMTLRNWRRLDTSKPLNPENAEMQIQFLGGVDESWFYIASVGVEVAGAPLVSLVHRCVGLSLVGSDAELTTCLEAIAAGLPAIQRATARTYEWCDPHMFYKRVRPYVAGWPEPGVLYEGVSDRPQKLIGGSAAQSSLIQMLDGLLAVDHSRGASGAYLLAVRRYMPIGHRAFVTDVEAHSQVRQRVVHGSPALRSAHDAVLDGIDVFRKIHLRLVHDYIMVPSGMAAQEKGTGGTNAVDFLESVRVDTVRTKLAQSAPLHRIAPQSGAT